MRRLVLLVPMLVALVGGAIACSDATNGSPVPGGTTTTEEQPPTGNTTPRTPTTTSRGGSGASPIKDTDPCSLLNSGAKTQLGLSGPGEKSDLGSARGCKWRLRGPSETFFFVIDIRDSVGIKDIPRESNPKELQDIGKHKAVQTSGGGGPGSCSVVLGVTESSTVTNTVLAGTDSQKACDLAMQLAKLVEPELP